MPLTQARWLFNLATGVHGTRTSNITTCHTKTTGTLHYITCHLADAFIQSDLQWIRLSRRHTPWSNVGLRASLKGPTAVQILSWPHQGSNPRPCGSQSISLTAMLQAYNHLVLRPHTKMSEHQGGRKRRTDLHAIHSHGGQVVGVLLVPAEA